MSLAGDQSSARTESAEKQPPSPDKRAASATKSSQSKKSGTTRTGPVQPPEGNDPEAAEKLKYDQAKATAMEDPEVQELKQKADAAGTEEEVRTALRAYNKALFRKMRRIDPELKDRIDGMEAGVMKRLGEQP